MSPRFIISAVILVPLLAIGGTLLGFAAVEQIEEPAVEAPKPELVRSNRPTTVAARPQKSRLDGSLRFASVPPHAGILLAPPGDAVTSMIAYRRDDVSGTASDPETWTVDVMVNDSTDVEGTEPDTASSEADAPPSEAPRRGRYTLEQRLAEISPGASMRVAKKLRAAKVGWTPTEVALVAIKDVKALDLYLRAGEGKWTFIHRYPVLAASGGKGPKLVRGDRQVPEGIYRITYLNPNSRYHVSLRVNYPNAFDRTMARKDGRRNLGGDIMIHGKKSSAGCLAIGDRAVEEVFLLASEVGLSNIKVIIAPTDFRKASLASYPDGPQWLPDLYEQIAAEMAGFEAPPEPSLLSLLGFSNL